MLERIKKLFGIRVEEKPLSQKLLGNILMSTSSKDYFRTTHGK